MVSFLVSLSNEQTDTFVSGTVASMALFAYIFVVYDLKEGQSLARIKDYTDRKKFLLNLGLIFVVAPVEHAKGVDPNYIAMLSNFYGKIRVNEMSETMQNTLVTFAITYLFTYRHLTS